MTSNTETVTETSNTDATVKRGRGRPMVYTGVIRQTIMTLLSSNGATNTRKILNSRNGIVGVTKAERADAILRTDLGIPKPVGISMPTLLKIAGDEGIALRRGRPLKVMVEVSPVVK